MSWWNRKARDGGNVTPPRMDSIPKLSDPNCVACFIRNESPIKLTFVSKLEEHLPFLIEAKGWVTFELEPNQKKLVPHRYWDILPHDAVRKISVMEIPRDHEAVEFLYQKRVIEQGNGAGDPHSQLPGSDTQLLDAEPLEKT